MDALRNAAQSVKDAAVGGLDARHTEASDRTGLTTAGELYTSKFAPCTLYIATIVYVYVLMSDGCICNRVVCMITVLVCTMHSATIYIY